MMKKLFYLTAAAAFLLIALPAAGAALAPKPATGGEVPKVEPLLPAPEGIYPNLQKNIQFEDPSHPSGSDSLPQSAETQEQVDVDRAPEEAASAAAAEEAGSAAQGKIFFAVFVLGGIGFLAFAAFKNKKS